MLNPTLCTDNYCVFCGGLSSYVAGFASASYCAVRFTAVYIYIFVTVGLSMFVLTCFVCHKLE